MIAVISQAGDLARRLAREAEAVCRHYLPHGRRNGRYWVTGDADDTPGRSLYVRLCGPDSGPGAAGKWSDAATGEHGDLLDLIGRRRHLSRVADAIGEARAFLALPCRESADFSPRYSHVPSGSSEAARRLFALGRPVPGTPAETYLRARGITARLDWPALRFHPSVWYRESEAHPREAWPALLAAVTDPRRRHHRHPAQLARPHAARQRRRLPIRAAPSAISSATASASALRQSLPPRRRGSWRPAKASKRCWRSPRCCRRCR